jgi:peptidoglycan/xylan/chitin deacetylase (PgdA/CDA1 family)
MTTRGSRTLLSERPRATGRRVAIWAASLLAVAACGPRAVGSIAGVVHPGCLFDVRPASRDRPLVALTIDDSPDPAGTPAILDTLRAYGARATFFVITDQIPGAEPVMERLRQEGHEVGNHFTSDRPTIRLDSASFERDLARSDSVLRRFGRVRWARPGSGWYSRRMVRAMERSGYRCALGTVYPLDGSIGWSWFSAQYIIANARPGTVVILHDRGERAERTAKVLGRVLPELRARGFEVVTLSELTASARE